jgi:hypothetical protein
MITAKPLDYIDINHFSFVERMDIVQGNSAICYIQLINGLNRYVPAAGSSVQLKFPRALSVAASPANQDVLVTLSVADPRDCSIYAVSLTSAQVDSIVGGGVKLIITSNGNTKTYPVDDFVRRRSNIPGA